jgi:hypothetical protein
MPNPLFETSVITIVQNISCVLKSAIDEIEKK